MCKAGALQWQPALNAPHLSDRLDPPAGLLPAANIINANEEETMIHFDRRALLLGAAIAAALTAFAPGAIAQADKPFVVIAELVAKPGQETALRELLVPFAAQSRSEPGCTRYELLEVQSEPGRFLTVEGWANKAAFDAHLTTPHIKAAIPLLGPILAKPFTQTLLDTR